MLLPIYSFFFLFAFKPASPVFLFILSLSLLLYLFISSEVSSGSLPRESNIINQQYAHHKHTLLPCGIICFLWGSGRFVPKECAV